jgi:hypothetical protein
MGVLCTARREEYQRDLSALPVINRGDVGGEPPPNWWTPLLSSEGSGRVSNGPAPLLAARAFCQPSAAKHGRGQAHERGTTLCQSVRVGFPISGSGSAARMTHHMTRPAGRMACPAASRPYVPAPGH